MTYIIALIWLFDSIHTRESRYGLFKKSSLATCYATVRSISTVLSWNNYSAMDSNLTFVVDSVIDIFLMCWIFINFFTLLITGVNDIIDKKKWLTSRIDWFWSPNPISTIKKLTPNNKLLLSHKNVSSCNITDTQWIF